MVEEEIEAKKSQLKYTNSDLYTQISKKSKVKRDPSYDEEKYKRLQRVRKEILREDRELPPRKLPTHMLYDTTPVMPSHTAAA